MQKPPDTSKVLMVLWEDANSPKFSGWVSPDHVHTATVLIVSVGFKLAEDDKSLTLVSSIAEPDECTGVSGAITIPKVNIKKRTLLKGPK